jgi:ABC-type transport system substrate-binding protein/class 3 adenylate cyclase
VPELPHGTVTFLFTDIEGSTRLLKQLGDRYAEVLDEHNRLLREAAAERGGREVDTQGDSFFFVFGRANAALEAAVAAQRALAGHPWPEGAVVRVRMGLHTGEPVVGGERYVGLGVHRAARIGAVAHGGQVLLSNATRELVEDEVGGVAVRDLGLYRLKDIDRPERLFQLDIDGLQTEFPPLTAEKVVARRLFRRKPVLVTAIAGVLAAAVAIPLLVLDGSGTGSDSAAAIGANSVGVINASSGHLLVSSATGPAASIVASRASVWVTSPTTDSVTRIDPETAARTGAVGVGRNPAGVAVGGGFVWVTNGLEGSVSKVDPDARGGSGAPVDTIAVGNGPSGIAFGGGRVWVANSTDRTVSMIDPRSDKPSPPISVPQGADAITYGSGFVWIVSGSANSVTRVNARSGTTLPPISVGNAPTAIAVGAGAAWVANSQDGTVSRIDLSTGAAKVIPVGGNPTGVAAGSGVVWVSDERAGTLSRIAPTTRKVVQTLETPKSPPQGLDMTAGKLYVAAGTPAAAHRGGTLKVLSEVFDSIDPAAAYASEAWSALVMTNDGLVTFQRVGGSTGARIVPDLATSLPTISDGGRTYTFQVRPGIHYSTGGLVQPADFRRAIERSLANESGTGGYFTELVGGTACAKSPKRCDLRRGVVVDPATRTITFHLTARDPDFLNKLALPGAFAVPASTRSKARLPLPATGPYKISHYDPKHGVTLVRNPRFHEWSSAAQPAGYPDRIAFTFGGSPTSRADAVKRGRDDYTPIPYDLFEDLQRGGYGNEIHVNPRLSIRYLFLNTRLAPFDRVDVRRALNYAVDHAKLARLAGPSTGQWLEPTCQVLPPNFVGYVRYCSYGRDLGKAKRLVAASGTAGQTVTVWTDSNFVPETDYLVSVLRSLGYTARRKVYSSDKYFAALAENGQRAQAGQDGWFADHPAPSQFFEPLFTCASSRPSPSSVGWNNALFCNPRIDREISRASALQLTDPQAAASLWSEIDRDVMRQAPIIPIGNGGTADLISRRAGNYQYNPQWGPLFDQMWVR